MTQAEWLDKAEIDWMLDFIRDKVADRKLRLFACACCRRIWALLPNDESRLAVKAVEAVADGKLGEHVLQPVYRAVEYPFDSGSPSEEWAKGYASVAARECAADSAQRAAEGASKWALDAALFSRMNLPEQERIEQALLLHEIVGNPFKPVTIDPRWLTATVVDLATAIYEERASDRMPILADALMDAGCDNEEIIVHCHNDEPHVRGCWVVDLLTGRE